MVVSNEQWTGVTKKYIFILKKDLKIVLFLIKYY